MTDLTEPRRGSAAHEYVLSASREVVDAVRTTLGPLGMNKMLVDANGQIAITNDGVTILQELAIDDPVGNLLLGAAEAQVESAGDGTTTTVILVGELLDGAERLLEEGLHASTVVRGYRLAGDLLALELDQLATAFEPGDTDVYRDVARTCLDGRDFGAVDVDRAVGMIVEAIERVTVDGVIDLDAISTHRQANRPPSSTRLVRGSVLEREPAGVDMPTAFDEASVLLLSRRLAPRRINPGRGTHAAAKGEKRERYRVRVDSPDQLARFQDSETDELRALADRIVELGVDAVFCPQVVDDRVCDHLSSHGVLAVAVGAHDLKHLATTTGATVVPSPADATDGDLGRARIGRDEVEGIFTVERAAAPRATLLLRGTSEELLTEFWRCVHNATEAIGRAADDPRVVAGGGATEAELARRLRIHADSVPGREQLGLHAVADALEAVPRTLARSAGLDPTDALLDLRNRHAVGDLDVGIEVGAGRLVDMYEAGVIEPFVVKSLAVNAAIDASAGLLRVDGILPLGHAFDYGADDEDAVKPGDVGDDSGA